MMRKASKGAVAFALRILPKDRKVWGEGMLREVEAIANDREALGFAVGCLGAALRERFDPLQTVVLVGRLGVGAVTAAYGAAHLYFASNGVRIAFGMLEPAPGNPTGNDLWAAVIYLVAMGASHLAAAFFLVVWRPRAFVIAFSCAVAFVSLVIGAGIVWMLVTDRPYPSMWGWQFVPLLMLGGAAAVLWKLSTVRRRSGAA